MGEIAPTYFASSEARERIARVTPAANIVCIFRNPVERIQSLYRVKRAYGMIPWNFEQAIVQRSGIDGIWPVRDAPEGVATNYRRGTDPCELSTTIYEKNRRSYVDQLADFIAAAQISS